MVVVGGGHIRDLFDVSTRILVETFVSLGK